jgi:lipid-binding SYLF domain-containing protein
MKTKTTSILFSIILLLFISTSLTAQEEKKEKKKKDPAKERAEIQKMKKTALKELYKLSPAAKGEIANAAGYAVFGNTGINLLLLSTQNGAGVATSGGKDTYMKTYSAGVGLGLGVKKFYAIFIFNTKKAYTNFIEEGWQAGGQADAAAKTKSDGGSASEAISLSPYIKLYQVTSKGIAAQLTIQGTKFWKDKDLN